MSGTPARWKSGCRPPGADNRDVYLGILGMTEEEYRRLAEQGHSSRGTNRECEPPGHRREPREAVCVAREPLEGCAGNCLPWEGRQAVPFLWILSSEYRRENFSRVFPPLEGGGSPDVPGLVTEVQRLANSLSIESVDAPLECQGICETLH